MICAATFMAAIGDVARFENPRKLVGYLGLDPKVRQSGSGPATHGRISKQGSASARHALVEASWSTVRQPGPIRAFYQRIKGAPRPPGRDRRRGAKARLPVLVSADAIRGLRLRPALVDPKEAAPARDPRRRSEPQGDPHRQMGRRRCDARGRARRRRAGRGRLPPHRRRLAGHPGKATERGRRRDTGARI